MDAAPSPYTPTGGDLDAASLGLALMVAMEADDRPAMAALIRHTAPAEVTWAFGRLAVLLLPLADPDHSGRPEDLARDPSAVLPLLRTPAGRSPAHGSPDAAVAPDPAPALTFLLAVAAGDPLRAERELADLSTVWFPGPAGPAAQGRSAAERGRRLVDDGLVALCASLLSLLAGRHAGSRADVARRLQQWLVRLRSGHTVLALTARAQDVLLGCRACPDPAHSLWRRHDHRGRRVPW